MSFVPAYIEIEKEPLPIFCHFVPEKLTLRKTAQWNAQTRVGSSIDRPNFTRSMAGTLRIMLWLDATEVPGRDVQGDAERLLKLMKPKTSLSNGAQGGGQSKSTQHRPPTCTFHWGATLSFECVLSNVTVTFLLFDNSGRPLRATADCTFTQVKADDDFGFQNPTSGGRTGERIHRLTPRETLDQVAYNAFGKTSLWRELAAFNGIDDPLRLQAGDSILLPPSANDLEEFA